MNKVAFEKKILKFTNKQSRQTNFIDNFDQKNFRTKIKRQNFDRNIEMIELLFKKFLRKLVIFFQKRIFERVHESKFIEKQSLMTRTIHEHKIKYQNIFNFYENHDEWKKWKIYLKIKLESNSWQFSTEKNKIYYARNHCKNLTWNIIEHRVDYDNSHSYESIDELINDLKNVCENFDKMNNAYNELFDDKFFMKFKNKNEIFDQYLSRFNNLITSLNLNDVLKVNQLFKIINKRLINAITHLFECKNYRTFVKKVRTIIHQKKTLNDIDRHIEFKTTRIFKAKIIDVFFWMIKNRKIDAFFINRATKRKNTEYNLIRLFFHIVFKFKTKKKCYKCFKSDHRINEQNVFCKNQKTEFKKKS